MAGKVRDVMTKNPVALPGSTSLVEAAQAMKERNIGNVLVVDSNAGEKLIGLVTDRDIVIRGIAEDHDPNDTTLEEIASKDLTSVSAEDDLDQVVQDMAQKKIRRVPVLEGQRAVGVLSLGDLAEQLDPKSVLAQISAAPATR